MSFVLKALKRAMPAFVMVLVLAVIGAILLPSLQRAKRNAGALTPEQERRYEQMMAMQRIADDAEAFSSSSVERAGASHGPRAESYYHASDELWVIVDPGAEGVRSDDPYTLGSGSLLVMPVGEDDIAMASAPVPLEHTEVSASITGHVASVNVRQSFHNPHAAKIEAVYVFPLPDQAAVNGFLMTVGDRTIRGVIREREEAERIYLEARSRGQVASLLHQQRPNIFKQKVANIEPGRSIDIDITYFQSVVYADGWYEYVFPMVVGPRFNPPSVLATGEGVAAVGRGPAGRSGQSTEVQYLNPAERSGHDIGLTLDINAGIPVGDIVSVNHTVELKKDGAAAHVRLAEHDSIPNKDFVLRYQLAGDRPRSGVVVARDGDSDGGYFSAMLMPPAELRKHERTPLELIFVLDCSGSMRGKPLEQSKLAMRTALQRLEPFDTFQIIRFSDRASAFGSRPVPATPQNIRRAVWYVEGLRSDGGTHMLEGVKAALEFPHDDGRLRFVTFLTDGYIGNEAEILRAMDDRLGASRVFSFGVGSSPNRYLMDRMARLGRGAAAYISLRGDGSGVMDAFFDRVAHAAMTDVTVDYGPLRGVEAFPAAMPDLFTGRPVIVTGRFASGYGAITSGGGGISFSGLVGGKQRTVAASSLDAAEVGASSLGAVWARAKIKELATRLVVSGEGEGDALVGEIESVALAHGLMSDYTSFVAVDSSRVTAGEAGYTLAVPVPVPDGVRYSTTVRE